jgi:hypothetical protein
VFGVPTVAVGDALFWGDDRLEEAAAALKQLSPARPRELGQTCDVRLPGSRSRGSRGRPSAAEPSAT